MEAWWRHKKWRHLNPPHIIYTYTYIILYYIYIYYKKNEFIKKNPNDIYKQNTDCCMPTVERKLKLNF